MDLYRNAQGIHPSWRKSIDILFDPHIQVTCIDGVNYTSTDGLHWEHGSGQTMPDDLIIYKLDERTLSAPFQRKNHKVTVSCALEKHRIWKRQWRYQNLGQPWLIELPFYFRPAQWPDIELFSVDPEEFALGTGCYNIEIVIDVGTAQRLDFFLLGEKIFWDAISNHLYIGEKSLYLKQDDGILHLQVVLDPWFYVLAGTDDILGFHRTNEKLLSLGVSTQFGTAGSFEGSGESWIVDLTVYGLRPLDYDPSVRNKVDKIGLQKILYDGGCFQIYPNSITDKASGKPDAYVLDEHTIISAQRVIEEFQWRPTPMGDMTRCLNRSDIWRGDRNLAFPKITTGIDVIDAAYYVALDVLQKARSGDYSLPGEAGLWSAGAFQGKDMGFGVWLRDSMQIITKGGAFWDAETSRRTLLYIMNRGKDNAVDGIPTPIICSWDYYLATHDLTTIEAIWPSIQDRLAEAEKYYNPGAQLFYADKSSANDAFADPDVGGYALSTEIYFMAAYRAAANIGVVLESPYAQMYAKRADELLRSIQQAYWNPRFRIFTAGPRGSKAFENGYWETCGQEAAIWERFGVANEMQRREILGVMEQQILMDYGMPLMPWRRERNHLTLAAWPIYYVGFAEAAGNEGLGRLLMRLIAQQIRNAVCNKTFFEVYESDSGQAWRWPAQTWHAMGYIAMLVYGVVGLRCNINGLDFSPCIPTELRGICIRNLCYCNMTLDIETTGVGQLHTMLLDGISANGIPWNMEGHHTVKLICDGEIG